jgi:hypothetical protein
MSDTAIPLGPSLVSAPGVIRGKASGLQQRLEYKTRRPLVVWNFRLERWDSSGSPMTRVPVEMRGQSFQGSLNNGDWIEVRAKWKPGKTVHASRVTDLSTSTVVRARGWGQPTRIARVVIALLMLAFFVAVAASILLTAYNW